MTEFTNNTATKYFAKGFTTFEQETTIDPNCLPFQNAKFGLLNLQAVACEPATIEHELVLVIDHTGSMGDKCLGDNDKTQMEQAIHTLKNIVGYLEEHPNIKANVTIFKFDDKFSKVVDRTTITEDNYKSIEKTISKIRENGGTDIGNALHETSKYISGLQSLYPTHQISHIFMTDGAVTTGETKPNILKQLVNKDVYNYFIGYGSKHDSELLGILSDFEKSSYHYIDAIEKSGLVFGEILHSITHKVLYSCEIVIEHGVIYNFETNLYTNKLYIGDIVGESNKVYHLFTDNPATCYVHLNTKEHSFAQPLEIHIFQETNHDLNFVNYAFRHRTLTLLCEVKQCQEKYDKSSTSWYSERNFNVEVLDSYKRKMKELFDEMRKYMEDNDKQNKFIKMLCDDIHISQKTFGTRYGKMCISSRQTSQGNQRIYTVNTTPLDRVKVTVNVNSLSAAYNSDDDDDEDDEDDVCRGPPSACSNNDSDSGEDIPQKMSMSASARPKPMQRSCLPSSCERSPAPSCNLAINTRDSYEVSNDCMEDSPYLTRTATTVMRSISYVSSDDEDADKSNSDIDQDDDLHLPDLIPINNNNNNDDDKSDSEGSLTVSP